MCISDNDKYKYNRNLERLFVYLFSYHLAFLLLVSKINPNPVVPESY